MESSVGEAGGAALSVRRPDDTAQRTGRPGDDTAQRTGRPGTKAGRSGSRGADRLGKRDALVRDAERRARQAPRTMTDDEGCRYDTRSTGAASGLTSHVGVTTGLQRFTHQVDLSSARIAPLTGAAASLTAQPRHGRCCLARCLACPPPADGERPINVAGVFLERRSDLAGRSWGVGYARLSSSTGMVRIPAVWRAYSAKPG
jgi:hypothetical protein